MSSSRGFSLIETLVALLISTLVVLSTGILGTRMFHRRTSSASISAATSLAERKIEELRPLRVPWTLADVDQTQDVDESGALSIGGPYRRRVQITAGPTAGDGALKRITVTVWHVTNAEVRAEVVTYFRVS